MPLSRLAIGICGVVVGAYCAYTAFRNGQNLADGVDGIAFGAAFAAVVVGSWFLLPLASQETGVKAKLTRAGWLLCVVFVLINAIGFTATHRTDKVGGNSVAITGYDQALAALNIARDELATMKANPRWASTSGCTNATAEKSLGFCQQVTAKQAEVTAAQATISKGRPGAVDAQADTIAWVIRQDASVVSRALPILFAVVLDIAASLANDAAWQVKLRLERERRRMMPVEPRGGVLPARADPIAAGAPEGSDSLAIAQRHRDEEGL
jgi:hypothetical protein